MGRRGNCKVDADRQGDWIEARLTNHVCKGSNSDLSRCLRHDRGRDASYLAPTGSPEAVTHLRLPQNVACGFAALRSSAVGSQHSLLFVQVSFPWSADLLFE